MAIGIIELLIVLIMLGGFVVVIALAASSGRRSQFAMVFLLAFGVAVGFAVMVRYLSFAQTRNRVVQVAMPAIDEGEMVPRLPRLPTEVPVGEIDPHHFQTYVSTSPVGWIKEVEDKYPADRYTFPDEVGKALAMQVIDKLEHTVAVEIKEVIVRQAAVREMDLMPDHVLLQKVDVAYQAMKAELAKRFDVSEGADSDEPDSTAHVTFDWYSGDSQIHPIWGSQWDVMAKVEWPDGANASVFNRFNDKRWLTEFNDFQKNQNRYGLGASSQLTHKAVDAEWNATVAAAEELYPVVLAKVSGPARTELAQKRNGVVERIARATYDIIQAESRPHTDDSPRNPYPGLLADRVTQMVTAEGDSMYRAAVLLDPQSEGFARVSAEIIQSAQHSQHKQRSQIAGLVGLFLVVGIFYAIAEVTTRGLLRGHVILLSLAIFVFGALFLFIGLV